MASSDLLDTAALFAADKAFELAGGYIGGKAGELAGHALLRLGPTLGHHFVKGAAAVKRKPVRTLLLVALGAVVAISVWKGLSQDRISNR